jgi:REP element-mobilizing transposase RayT
MKSSRRSIRLPGYDYATAGLYFVTICSKDRRHLFSNVVRAICIRPEGPELELNQLGMIVQQEWMKSAEMRTDVELGEFVVMPNHFHAIIGLNGNAGIRQIDIKAPSQTEIAGVCNTPLRSPSETIGSIVRGFKSAVTRQARQLGLAEDVWHRNYYEHIIRNEVSHNKIAAYIRNNPASWEEDEYFR